VHFYPKRGVRSEYPYGDGERRPLQVPHRLPLSGAEAGVEGDGGGKWRCPHLTWERLLPHETPAESVRPEPVEGRPCLDIAFCFTDEDRAKSGNRRSSPVIKASFLRWPQPLICRSAARASSLVGKSWENASWTGLRVNV